MRHRLPIGVACFVAAVLVLGCGKEPDKDQDKDKDKDKTTFTSPGGKKYAVHVEEFDAPHDETEKEGTGAAAASDDDYVGKDRKAAKLSIADAKIVPFDDLADLLESLTSDEDMKKLVKAGTITTAPTSDRVKEEKRNVRVRAWLYAASREKDHDFHLILGREPGKTPKKFMTAEVSGLPALGADFRAELKVPRDAFKTFFTTSTNGSLPGTGYSFYSPPIPVLVEGSLFYDATHAFGPGPRPGPASLRPDMPTIWEIHPISKIVFEPSP